MVSSPSHLFMSDSPPGDARRRAGVFAAVGAFLAAFVMLQQRYGTPLGGTDFDQVWVAAKAVLRGADPYATISGGDETGFVFPLYYPLTAVFVGLPFSMLELPTARLAFVSATGALFGWAIGLHRPWLWPVFLGPPFLLIGRNAQWSALITAAMLLPGLGPFAAVGKPNLGVAMLAGARSASAAKILVLGGLALVALSLAIRPDWPWRWYETLERAEHFSPLMLRPGGFLMLLALLRWWDPDARLLLALAAVPQTGLFYDILPACLVARTRYQAAIITVATQVSSQGIWYLGPGHNFVEVSWKTGILVLWGGLIPPLVIVLRRGLRRPAAGDPTVWKTASTSA
jgi:hypothetical protein